MTIFGHRNVNIRAAARDHFKHLHVIQTCKAKETGPMHQKKTPQGRHGMIDKRGPSDNSFGPPLVRGYGLDKANPGVKGGKVAVPYGRFGADVFQGLEPDLFGYRIERGKGAQCPEHDHVGGLAGAVPKVHGCL